MVNDQECAKALEYLKKTDVEAAKAMALYKGLEDQKKTVLAMLFMVAEGAQGERAKKAEASKEYREHLEKMNHALQDYEILRNRRLTASLQIEVWRSFNANRRTGNI